MEPITLGYLGIVVMLVLALCGIHLGLAMISVSMLGIWYVMDFNYAAMQVALLAWDKGTDSVLMCIPLFILMGQLVYRTGIIGDLFTCVRTWFGHLPGGLGVAAVFACAGFGAVTGSTIAATATMGATVMPELEKSKYDVQLASATLAASGGLAAIIPPSVGFILYGVLTDCSIAQLFMSGVIPGLLLAGGYSGYVVIRCMLNPALGPRGPVYPLKERVKSLFNVLPVTALFLLVIGGIYGGIFTPTEAAGIGVSGTIAIALVMRRINWSLFKTSVKDSALLATSIFIIVYGGYLLSRFLVITGTTAHLVNLIISQQMSPYLFAVLVAIIYMILGCILDSFGLCILTVPILYPMAISYGFDPVWFGCYVTMLICVGTITPPVGVNVYVLHGVLQHIPSSTIFRGVIPFCIVHMIITILTVIFPGLATWLPYTM